MMTPEQKVKQLILLKIAEWSEEAITVVATGENIDEMYEASEEKWDAINEIRPGEVETDIPAPYSRHYEAKSVAAKMPDGSWVGWTYWYGGGKHGEPEAIDWIEEAYDLDVTEEEKVVTVRTFALKND